jgi:indoleamine 2,3-dioxygenase
MSHNSIHTKYDLSSYGFLAEPCTSLPAHFQFIDELADNLHEDDIRSVIDYLPEINHELEVELDHASVSEIKRIYSISCMALNRYVWCTGVEDAKNHSVIPPTLSWLLVTTADKLGIVPSLTHAAVDLYNWHIVDSDLPFSLENIEINHTMTNDVSEAWFYKIMIAIEGLFGKSRSRGYHEEGNLGNLLPKILEYEDGDLEQSDFNDGGDLLQEITDTLLEAAKLVGRMMEHCDPDFFFHHIRIYLSGSENKHLPHGVTLQLPEHNQIIKYKGGSAAQSSLIQILDVFLDVKHDGKVKEYLDDMLKYMPKRHRQAIDDLRAKPRLKLNHETTPLYNNCIRALLKFRGAHMKLVNQYVMAYEPEPVGCGADKSTATEKVDSCEDKSVQQTNDENEEEDDSGVLGTGGTHPRKFCGKVIADTNQALKEVTKPKVILESYNPPIDPSMCHVAFVVCALWMGGWMASLVW